MNVICSTLNAKYIHTNLAIRYLKAFAAPEFNIQLKEYTIKDPVIEHRLRPLSAKTKYHWL